MLHLFQHYAQTLICTLSATSTQSLKQPLETINCNRMGCECHILDDLQYRILIPLLTILLLSTTALAFFTNQPTESPQGRQICIECGHPVASLYTEYGIGHIRLTQCEHCKSFADKYVEHDVVIVFIDMLLHKPQVYRHLLVNQLEFQQSFIDRNITKLGILLVLFNVYIDWFRLEEGGRLRGQTELLFGKQYSFALQYILILMLSVLDAVVHLLGILLATIILERNPQQQIKRWATISTTMIVSSFGKVLMIMLVIWEYNEPYYPWLLDFLLFTSHSTAFSVLFNVGVVWAGLVIVFGTAIKQLVHFVALTTIAVLVGT